VTAPLVIGIPLWLAQTNAWIVAPDGPGGEAVLIDAPPDPATIVRHLREHDLRLVALFTTHGHIDHVGGIGSLVHGHDPGPDHGGEHGPAGAHPVEVRIHDADRDMLVNPLAHAGMFARYLGDLDLRPPEVIHGIDDGERIRGAGMTFTALHTPGHTRGSVCFTLEMDGSAPILFSGDHLFAGSIGRTDLPGGSFDALMRSMVDKVLPLADDTRVLPGHGPATTVGRERHTNPFLVEIAQRGGRRDS
jgi:glyoxylase-like metal-dependent hydrolase (beta-lactamase superfamily II)